MTAGAPTVTSGTVLNLTFHGVGDPPRGIDEAERRVWVSREAFYDILDRIGERDDVRLTFDDGNSSDVTTVLPALAERGLTASFFPVVGRIGEPGFVGAADVRLLINTGMKVGSHGMSHRAWRRLSASDLWIELRGARATLEAELGRPVVAAACPFGAYDRRVLRGLRAAGFLTVFTSDGGRVAPSGWLQARNTICGADARDSVERLLRLPGGAGIHRRRVELLVKRWR